MQYSKQAVIYMNSELDGDLMDTLLLNKTFSDKVRYTG